MQRKVREASKQLYALHVAGLGKLPASTGCMLGVPALPPLHTALPHRSLSLLLVTGPFPLLASPLTAPPRNLPLRCPNALHHSPLTAGRRCTLPPAL